MCNWLRRNNPVLPIQQPKTMSDVGEMDTSPDDHTTGTSLSLVKKWRNLDGGY